MVVFTCSSVYAQMDVPPNGFNPKASITEDVGITSITIDYSRPGVKGREGKIWGGVVPYDYGHFNFKTGTPGSPWRAGANYATTITFEHDVKVEGQEISAGTYALFMAVGQEETTVIFSNQAEAWGSFYYDSSDDVLKVKVKPVKLDKSVEWMKFEFIEHTENSCVIALQWEYLSIPFKVEVDVENIVLKRIREEFIGVKGFITANKLHASMYCFNNGINMEEALGWAESAISGKPFGQTGFSAYKNLALGYNKMNQQAKADSIMQVGLAIANEREFNDYCRELIGAGRNKKGLEVMQSAEKRFGSSFSVNNGLSIAYSANGDNKKAILSVDDALKYT